MKKLFIKTNTNQQFCFDQENIESICYDNFSVEPVDIGLSVKWAPMNLGAKNQNERGNTYSWGNIIPAAGKVYEKDFLLFDSECKLYNCSKPLIESTRDIASIEWGNKWRLPTLTEIQEMCDKCSFEFDSRALIVTGPNGNSLSFIYDTYDNSFEGDWAYSHKVVGLMSNQLANDKEYYSLLMKQKYLKGENKKYDWIRTRLAHRSKLSFVRPVFNETP